MEFRYFFVRKLMLDKYSYGFIVCRGIGKLDEFFEIVVRVQTERSGISDRDEGREYCERCWRSSRHGRPGTIDRATRLVHVPILTKSPASCEGAP